MIENGSFQHLHFCERGQVPTSLPSNLRAKPRLSGICKEIRAVRRARKNSLVALQTGVVDSQWESPALRPGHSTGVFSTFRTLSPQPEAVSVAPNFFQIWGDQHAEQTAVCRGPRRLMVRYQRLSQWRFRLDIGHVEDRYRPPTA